MSTSTFIPPKAPSYPCPVKVRARVNSLSYGDGYGQSCADGMNSVYDEVSPIWEELTKSQVDAMDAYFRDLEGVTPFFWTHPSKSTPQKWTCRTWTPNPTTDSRHSFTATFVEDFSLDD